jgi:hypothetical protein
MGGDVMNRIAFAIGILVLLAGPQAVRPAAAGCTSDCRVEYDSEIDSCRLLYSEPDEADDLRMCIDNAKSEYDSCVYECSH